MTVHLVSVFFKWFVNSSFCLLFVESKRSSLENTSLRNELLTRVSMSMIWLNERLRGRRPPFWVSRRNLDNGEGERQARAAWAWLKAQTVCCVFDEELAGPDVLAQGNHGFVARLLHDGGLRDAISCCLGRMSGAQAVPREVLDHLFVETGAQHSRGGAENARLRAGSIGLDCTGFWPGCGVDLSA